MKVTSEFLKLAEQYQAKQAEVNRNETGKTFGDALANELELDGTPALVEGSGCPEMVERMVTGGEIPPEWHAINGVVDSMERYGEALGNPVYSLKDLEPLAADMEDQVESLLTKLDEGEFGSLRELAQEVLAEAQIASIKFRRGDYV
jgi:hypothetical protein